MKMLRLLGLSAAMVVVILVEVRPVFAACGPCDSDAFCKSCTGSLEAICRNRRCLF